MPQGHWQYPATVIKLWLWGEIQSRLIGLLRNHCRDLYAIMRNRSTVPFHSAFSPQGVTCNYSCGAVGGGQQIKKGVALRGRGGSQSGSQEATESLRGTHTLPCWQECQCISRWHLTRHVLWIYAEIIQVIRPSRMSTPPVSHLHVRISVEIRLN